jgi:hypothetical protein
MCAHLLSYFIGPADKMRWRPACWLPQDLDAMIGTRAARSELMRLPRVDRER